MNRKRSSKKLIAWLVVAAVIVVAVAGFAASRKHGKAKSGEATVKVEKGNVVEKALAVGSIVPRNEISVKSKVSGVVKKIHKEPGEHVAAGEALIEVQPDPTPLELADATRRVEMDEIAARDSKKRLDRAHELVAQGLVSDKEFDDADREAKQSALQLEMSRERLALIEKGHVSIAGNEIDAIVKSPIKGFVLEKSVNLGDPVVPLTSYQEGTVLMTIADMDSLIFKGTVDEIDVGKLNLGMPVEIKIGALPGKSVPGKLTKISLKAKEENNTRMFPVEIAIADPKVALLRAGYSANADIIIKEADSVLTIPERVVYTKGDTSYVEVPGAKGARDKVYITTGLSDAVRVEVKSGLKNGQVVLEKPEKKI